MKNLLIIPFVLLLLSCGGTKQVAYAPADEQAIYSVINFCLANDSIGKGRQLSDVCKQSRYNDAIFEGWKGVDTILTKDQRAYLYMQHTDATVFTIQKSKVNSPEKVISFSKIPGWPSLDVEEFWNGFYQTFGTIGFVTFSKPLFTPDGNTAVISCDKRTNPDDGVGYTYILQKEPDGKWNIRAKIFGFKA